MAGRTVESTLGVPNVVSPELALTLLPFTVQGGDLKFAIKFKPA